MSTPGNLKIDGTIDDKFKSVSALFERELSTLAERNSQLCIYVGEDKVVDLWGTAIGDQGFNADSLVNVFSSGKSLEAIAVAFLFEQGLLQYTDLITQHWPEFGQAGKDQLTIADLMRHEAGLASLSVSINPEDLLTENIKQNKIGAILEQHPAHFKPGENNQREYHAVSRGWIINELFRRIDKNGRTIGEFLEQEISNPLNADAQIGVKQSDLGRRSAVHMLPFGYHLRQTFKPIFMGRKVKDNIFQLGAKVIPMIPRMRNGNSNPDSKPPYTGMDSVEFFNEEIVARGETPSANSHCSARGLGKIAAVMANGGSLNGTTYLSEQAWQAMHAEPVVRNMAFETTFTQGGVAHFGAPGRTRLERAANQGREGFYGWMGLGGSIFQWHPEKKIGFSFVPTSLHAIDLVNERGKMFQKEILRCLS